jgi:hypothetical protein
VSFWCQFWIFGNGKLCCNSTGVMAPYVLFKCQFWIFGRGQVWPPASLLPCGRDFQPVLPVALWLGSWPALGPLPCSMACLPACLQSLLLGKLLKLICIGGLSK